MDASRSSGSIRHALARIGKSLARAAFPSVIVPSANHSGISTTTTAINPYSSTRPLGSGCSRRRSSLSCGAFTPPKQRSIHHTLALNSSDVSVGGQICKVPVGRLGDGSAGPESRHNKGDSRVPPGGRVEKISPKSSRIVRAIARITVRSDSLSGIRRG